MKKIVLAFMLLASLLIADTKVLSVDTVSAKNDVIIIVTLCVDSLTFITTAQAVGTQITQVFYGYNPYRPKPCSMTEARSYKF